MESDGYNSDVELLRTSGEFPQLLGDTVAYLDHAGTTLYARSQIRAVMEDLEVSLHGNPHSGGSPSGATTALRIDQARHVVLEHFRTSSAHYQVVFTSGATAALRLAMDCFAAGAAWNGRRGRFAYAADSHTSVVGLREIAAERGFQVEALLPEELCWNDAVDNAEVDFAEDAQASDMRQSLLVVPAQCNFAGWKQDLRIVEAAHANRLAFQQSRSECWHVLLDAACFSATCVLDLSRWKPSYVALSFYKLLGYPSGLGALLVRRGAAEKLLRGRAYFGGGNVEAVMPRGTPLDPAAAPRRQNLADALEAGTLPFLAVASLPISFQAFYKLIGSMEQLERHVFSLAAYMRRGLLDLHHEDTGQPLVTLYCPNDCTDVVRQGGLLSFNLNQRDGSPIGYSEIEARANAYQIHLRTGCFCNVGACQRYLGLTDEQLWRNLAAGHVCGDKVALVDGWHTGAVRASFGYSSTKADADRLLLMLQDCFLTRCSVSRPLPTEGENFADSVAWCSLVGLSVG